MKTFIVGDMFCSLDLEDGYVIGTPFSDVTNDNFMFYDKKSLNNNCHDGVA